MKTVTIDLGHVGGVMLLSLVSIAHNTVLEALVLCFTMWVVQRWHEKYYEP